MVRASDDLARLPLFIDDKPGRTMTQVAAIARRLHRKSPIWARSSLTICN
jgi:replicative DNA helicase